jgi:hypothetical protein
MNNLRKRIESLTWRISMMSLAFFIDIVIQNLTNFNIPAEYSVVIGLIFGEISKELKYRYDLKKEF